MFYEFDQWYLHFEVDEGLKHEQNLARLQEINQAAGKPGIVIRISTNIHPNPLLKKKQLKRSGILAWTATKYFEKGMGQVTAWIRKKCVPYFTTENPLCTWSEWVDHKPTIIYFFDRTIIDAVEL